MIAIRERYVKMVYAALVKQIAIALQIWNAQTMTGTDSSRVTRAVPVMVKTSRQVRYVVITKAAVANA
jgi:hypothetical protein